MEPEVTRELDELEEKVVLLHQRLGLLPHHEGEGSYAEELEGCRALLQFIAIVATMIDCRLEIMSAELPR